MDDQTQRPFQVASSSRHCQVLAHAALLLTFFMATELAVLLSGALRLPLFTYSLLSPFEQLEPNGWRLISEAGLPFFLLANGITGALNVFSGDLAGLGQGPALGLIMGYAGALLAFAAAVRRPAKLD